MDIDKETAVASWLTECKQALNAIDKIGQSIILLNSKRSTLEEKMIKSYLSELAVSFAGIISRLHEKLVQDDVIGNEETLIVLAELTSETNSHLDELIKIITYNPNFLEQYFEHDFLASIKEKRHLVDRAKTICQAMA